jgi:hypothetical protein
VLRLIDDRSSGSLQAAGGAAWRCFTDRVMGGESSAELTLQTIDGRPALCLRGHVSLARNGGFIQMALELMPPADPPPLGLELDVRGDGRHYGLHLRTADMDAPWQAWRAPFVALPGWQTVQLPFDAFVPHRTGGRLDPARIRRIGLVAIGEPGAAALCLARLAWC